MSVSTVSPALHACDGVSVPSAQTKRKRDARTESTVTIVKKKTRVAVESKLDDGVSCFIFTLVYHVTCVCVCVCVCVCRMMPLHLMTCLLALYHTILTGVGHWAM